METNTRLLSFEWDADRETLEIHANPNGIRYLRSVLDHMLTYAQPDHVHLMTKEWGGAELSSERQNSAAVPINHVKVMTWPEQS